MNDLNYTYRFKQLLGAVLVWELLFWVLSGVLLFLLGFLDSGSIERLGFKNDKALWLLTLTIPVLILYFYNLTQVNRIAGQTNDNLRKLILSPVNSKRSFIRFFLFRNALVLLIFALSQPVFGTRKVSGTIESMELVICLDISNSMNTKDISEDMTRLDVAKRSIVQLVNNLHGEKIGICLFAGGAFVQLPLTSDYNAAKLFTADISTDMISNQGTNISEALKISASMFSEQKTSKAIILVTDGENHEEDPSAILSEIKEKKIAISVLGIGTSSGGPVPLNPYRPELGYKKTAIGTTVVSRLNPRLIHSIAAKGGGTALISDSEFPDLRELLTEINQMKRTKIRDLQFDMKENHYQVPLFISLFCWILFLFLSSGTTSTLKE